MKMTTAYQVINYSIESIVENVSLILHLNVIILVIYLIRECCND